MARILLSGLAPNSSFGDCPVYPEGFFRGVYCGGGARLTQKLSNLGSTANLRSLLQFHVSISDALGCLFEGPEKW